MSYFKCIMLILLFAGMSIDGYSQKSNSRRFAKYVVPKDPLKAKEFLIDRSKTARGNFKIYYSLLLADFYERSGDFTLAEKTYTETYSEVRKNKVKPGRALFKNGGGTVYDSYDRLGYFYLRTGNLRKAEQIFNESRAVRDSLFRKRSVHRIHPIVGLGSLSYRRGDYTKALILFGEAEKKLNIATTTFYDFDKVTRLFLSDLAEICMTQNKNEQAWDYINKLSIASSGISKFETRMSSKLETARIMELKARYFMLTGDLDKAQEYIDQSLKYYPVKIGSSDVKFKILKTQALLHWYAGKNELSNEAFLSLIKSYREHIAKNFISMSDYEKEQFYNTLRGDFNLFNAYAVSQYATASSTILFEEIYNNVLNTKALLLNGTNKIKNNIMRGLDSELKEKFQLWEQGKAKLSSAYFDKKSVDKIDSLEDKIEQLEKEINQKSKLFNVNQNAATWQQVRNSLKEKEAAIEILRVNSTKQNDFSGKKIQKDSTIYVAMIIKKDSKNPECVFFPNGNQMERKFISYYRNSIFSRIENQFSYNQFWLPLKESLKGIEKIYLSPDGVYNQINLNTLKNPASQQYLLDELELVYLTNTADLLHEKVVVETGGAALFGRPSYGFEAQSATLIKSSTYGTRDVITDELESFRDQEFSDLPGTETEITAIEKILSDRKISVNTFVGQKALEENVKTLENPSILHIATHGFFVDDQASLVSPMIRSGLILAGVKNQGSQQSEDGILTAYEATNLNLEKTNLVVLSACETGLGEVRNGEGVYGLQRAIIVAGANNLLMSLWKVDDQATAELMTEMYRALDFKDNQTGFRNAQKALRQKYPEPFYWGAFIMLGN
jgi:CHAT domain-containing protein